MLIPGDISWGLKLEQAQHDFAWLAQFLGTKCFLLGIIATMRKVKKGPQILPEGMEWIDADYTIVEEWVVAATRGWSLPGDRFWEEERDRRIYERQVGRLRIALESAAREEPSGSEL